MFTGLTLGERGFLERSGWSALHRTPVEWPSLLETGPHGWLMQAALVIAGALGLVFGWCLFAAYPVRLMRIGAMGLLLMSLAVGSMALPPDRPGVANHSWTDAAHNGIYPVIPITAVAAGLALAFARPRPVAGLMSRASALFVVVGLVTLGLSAVGAIAQLVRFVFFAFLLGWVFVVAVSTGRSNSADT